MPSSMSLPRLCGALAMLLPLVLGQWLEPPPTAADPNTPSDCSMWMVAESGNTCAAIATEWGLTLSDFTRVYNPSLVGGCNLIAGHSYCVERNFGLPSEPTTTPPTSTGNGVSTPSPIQTGMVGNCNKFYLVKKGDSCADVATNHGIALTDFYAWNPAVKNDCSKLLASVNVCVGIIGGSVLQPTTTSATTPPNGVTTPVPTQAGMVPGCNQFYFVSVDDSCADIAAAKGIALSDFYAWNPAVKADCSGLWANVYVCVGRIGHQPAPTTTTTTRSTTTTPGNGITTPTPTRPSMVNNCNRFHFTQSGEGCQEIADQYSVSIGQFYTWNPSVRTDCSGLWANVYVCVGIIGFSPPP